MEAVSATDRSIMGGDNVATSLSLMRRLPPAKIEQNLSGLLNLVPEDQEELLQRIDQPLEVASDADVSTACCQIGA
jgi:capping protein beta